MIKNVLILLVMGLVGLGMGIYSTSQVNSLEDLKLGMELKIINPVTQAEEIRGCNIKITTIATKAPALILPAVFAFPEGLICGSVQCADESKNREFECIPSTFLFKTQKQKQQERGR